MNCVHISDTLFAKHGYKLEQKICNTLQGAMYKVTKSGINYAIKQTSKQLHHSGEALDEDGFTVIVEENIIKEALILHHLTVTNQPMGGYIVKYIDFFESDIDYYLVIEYTGNMNLQQLNDKAHKYINEGKLSLSDYQKIIKFITWQIAVTLQWYVPFVFLYSLLIRFRLQGVTTNTVHKWLSTQFH